MITNDDLIIEKARKRVKLRCKFTFILLLLFYVALFAGYYAGYLTSNVSNLYQVILFTAVSELCLFGLNTILLGFGKKIFRFLYWFVVLYSFALLYVPFQYITSDLTNIVSYLVWIIADFIKSLYLLNFGKTLKTNKWCKILFDWILEIEVDDEDDEDEEQEEEEIEHILLTEKPKQTDDEELDETEDFTLPNLSLRLGICIYVSLMIFPIFTQFFQNFFASSDMKTVFATKDLFILCIFTSMIWTIPVFFYYYNHPKSKMVTYICIALDLGRVALYIPKFINYIQHDDYPLRVYIGFIVINLIRYLWLFMSIKPIFKMEMPEELEE